MRTIEEEFGFSKAAANFFEDFGLLTVPNFNGVILRLLSLDFIGDIFKLLSPVFITGEDMLLFCKEEFLLFLEEIPKIFNCFFDKYKK